MARQITLTVSDEEYQKYVDGLAVIHAVKDQCSKPKLLIVFNVPLSLGIVPHVNVPLPPAPEPLRRNGLEFQGREDYESHRRFFKQAMADLDLILCEGGRL